MQSYLNKCPHLTCKNREIDPYTSVYALFDDVTLLVPNKLTDLFKPKYKK